MAVRVTTPTTGPVERNRFHPDAVAYDEGDGLLRVRGENRKQIALYNRECWLSAEIIRDEKRTEYGDIVDRG